MTKSSKSILLDEWRSYEDYAKYLRNAYFALKYNDREGAINYLKCGELSGLPEKMVSQLIEAIRKEQGNENHD